LDTDFGGAMKIRLDHSVIMITDWARSNAFYQAVLMAEVVPKGSGFVYRLANAQLNVQHVDGHYHPLARTPVAPGNSDLCLEWPGPIAGAVAHLNRCKVSPELGPVRRFGSKNWGQSVYFRDPDGSLLEFISYDDNGSSAE
jgi:catechol 2,3-dioxygenase-like lactoylglutathione lyase family enzyme